MWGTIVNVIAIVVGSLIGCLLNKGIPDKVHKVIMQGLGLSTLVIGMSAAIATENVLILIISLTLGGAIGRFIGIEDGLDRIGAKIQSKFSSSDSKIAEGFVTATLIYCVGAMAVYGAIESGINKNYEILYVKSLLDGIASVVLASTLGFGVMLSAVSVLIYQGAITLGASYLAPFMTDAMMLEISAVGGALIIGIGINLLDIKKIHIGDMLPSILIPPIYFLVTSLF